jgi:hypothetical protein
LRVWTAGLLWGLLLGVGTGVSAAEPEAFKILKLEGNNVRWHKTTAGPLVVSYSLVDGLVQFPGARNCRKMTGMDSITAASRVTTEALRQEIAAAFAMWEAAADISFVEAADPALADIRIGAQAEPEGWAFADVFYDTRSTERVKPISRSLICLNPAKPWKIGFDGDLKTYDLRYTIAHEIGHAIGLDHPVGGATIMGYRYEERFRRLQPGDVAGAIVLYGHRGPMPTIAASVTKPEAAAQPHAPAAKTSGTRAFDARSH